AAARGDRGRRDPCVALLRLWRPACRLSRTAHAAGRLGGKEGARRAARVPARAQRQEPRRAAGHRLDRAAGLIRTTRGAPRGGCGSACPRRGFFRTPESSPPVISAGTGWRGLCNAAGTASVGRSGSAGGSVNILSQDFAAGLFDRCEPPCLTLYQPTHRHHPERQQDRIRYRNLVRSLEASLRKLYPARDATPLLEPFHQLENDDAFWMRTRD